MTTARYEVMAPCTAEQMFAIVADVGSYPQFVPKCSKTCVVELNNTTTNSTNKTQYSHHDLHSKHTIAWSDIPQTIRRHRQLAEFMDAGKNIADNIVLASISGSLFGIELHYWSLIILDHHSLNIRTHALSGMFSRLSTRWWFEPQSLIQKGNTTVSQCLVGSELSIADGNPLLAKIITRKRLRDFAYTIVESFIQRAVSLHAADTHINTLSAFESPLSE